MGQFDPAELVNAVLDDVKLGASFVVTNFLKAMLGSFAAKFRIVEISSSFVFSFFRFTIFILSIFS